MNHEGRRPASPCIQVCRIAPQTGLCEGCLRTLDEIAAWGQASEAQREVIWRAIEGREAARQRLGASAQRPLPPT